LAETMPMWAEALAPVAERVAHTLGHAMAGKYVPSTPLTAARGRRAQAVVKARKAATKSAATSTSGRQWASQPSAPSPWSCPDCGGAVSNHRHVRCDACIDADPRQTASIRGRRAAAISSRRRKEAEWDQANPGVHWDPDYFDREIRPRLGVIKLPAIMEACGVAKSTAWDWRAARRRPHPSHWAALAKLASAKV
jgi:hypothetical protein